MYCLFQKKRSLKQIKKFFQTLFLKGSDYDPKDVVGHSLMKKIKEK